MTTTLRALTVAGAIAASGLLVAGALVLNGLVTFLEENQ